MPRQTAITERMANMSVSGGEHGVLPRTRRQSITHQEEDMPTAPAPIPRNPVRKRGMTVDAFSDQGSSTAIRRRSMSISSAVANGPQGDVTQLDKYVEGLYEDMDQKLDATARIRSLASGDVRNLYILAENASLLPALSRTLIEDGKQSMELCTNILHLFICFAANKDFHPLLMKYRAGDTTIKILQREIGRATLWRSEIDKLDGSRRKYNMDKLSSLFRRQDDLLIACFHLLLRLADDIMIEIKMVKRDIVGFLASVLDMQLTRSSMLEGDNGSPSTSLLLTVLTFFLRLSCYHENHLRMLALGAEFIDQLNQLINSPETKIAALSIQIVNNLCQVARFRENFVELNGFVDKCVLLMQDQNRKLANSSSNTIYLVSMTEIGREKIVDTPVISTSMRIFLESGKQNEVFQHGTLLCNLAQNQIAANMICGMSGSKKNSGAGLKMLMKRALKDQEPVRWKLLRVLAASSREIQMRFLPFVDDIMGYCLKLDKNQVFNADTDNHKEAVIFITIFGIIGSLEIEEFDFGKLNERYGLLNIITFFIVQNLHQTRRSLRTAVIEEDENGEVKSLSAAIESSDDILIESLGLLRTMLLDEELTPVILNMKVDSSETSSPGTIAKRRPTAASRTKSTAKTSNQATVLELLLDTIQLKQDDEHVLLEAMKTLFSFLSNLSAIKDESACDPKLADAIGKFVWDANPGVRNYSELCMSALEGMSSDPNFGTQIGQDLKEKRFQFHNPEWVLSVQDEIMELVDEFEKDQSAGPVPEVRTELVDDDDGPMFQYPSSHLGVRRLSDNAEFMLSQQELAEPTASDRAKDGVMKVHGQTLQFV